MAATLRRWRRRIDNLLGHGKLLYWLFCVLLILQNTSGVQTEESNTSTLASPKVEDFSTVKPSEIKSDDNSVNENDFATSENSASFEDSFSLGTTTPQHRYIVDDGALPRDHWTAATNAGLSEKTSLNSMVTESSTSSDKETTATQNVATLFAEDGVTKTAETNRPVNRSESLQSRSTPTQFDGKGPTGQSVKDEPTVVTATKRSESGTERSKDLSEVLLVTHPTTDLSDKVTSGGVETVPTDRVTEKQASHTETEASRSTQGGLPEVGLQNATYQSPPVFSDTPREPDKPTDRQYAETATFTPENAGQSTAEWHTSPLAHPLVQTLDSVNSNATTEGTGSVSDISRSLFDQTSAESNAAEDVHDDKREVDRGEHTTPHSSPNGGVSTTTRDDDTSSTDHGTSLTSVEYDEYPVNEIAEVNTPLFYSSETTTTRLAKSSMDVGEKTVDLLGLSASSKSSSNIFPETSTAFEDLGESSTPNLEEETNFFMTGTTTKTPNHVYNPYSNHGHSIFSSEEISPETGIFRPEEETTTLFDNGSNEYSEVETPVADITDLIEDITQTSAPEDEVTVSKEMEPLSKHHENLSQAENNNAVTVIFHVSPDKKMDIFWYEERNRKFRKYVVDSINAEEVNGWPNLKDNNISYDDIVEHSKRPLNSLTPDDLVYIKPSPAAENRTIYVAFYVRNQTSSEANAVVSADKIVYALHKHVLDFQEEMGMNISQITKGIILVKVLQPFFVRHAVVFISLLGVAVFCILVIIIALIYIRCRSSRGQWDKGEYGDKHKLKRDMKLNREIGDLQSDRDIQNDESQTMEKNGHYLNGNGLHALSLEDEGWVVPYDQHLPQKTHIDMEDTKL